MKLLAFCLVLLLLSGCMSSHAELPEQTFLQESSEDHHDPRWTETELLTAFYQYAEMGTTVIDCVVFPESGYGIVGVVQYTLEDEEGCLFDFLDGSGFPRRADVMAEPSGEGTLEYLGEDTVSCVLLGEDGAEYTCTITYYEDNEKRETGFRITG